MYKGYTLFAHRKCTVAAHRKCTVAAVHNLSVQVIPITGNVWGNFREAITPLFTAGLKGFLF